MWEQRADGKRKLKPNAVPTVFGFFLKKELPITENENNEVETNNTNDISDNVSDNDVCNHSINNKNKDVEKNAKLVLKYNAITENFKVFIL